MAKLSNGWWNAFGGSFDNEEDVLEFIFEHIDTKGWEDSYKDMGGHREPNEMFKITVDDKKQVFYDFMMDLLNKASYLK